jgi:hypothetical protein
MAANQRRRGERVVGILGLALVGLAWWTWRADPSEAPAKETPRQEPQRRARAPVRPTVIAPPPLRPLGYLDAPREDSQMGEAPPPITVRCRAEAALLEALADVVVEGRRVPFTVNGDELVLEEMPVAGMMTLLAEGSASIQAFWVEAETPGVGRCVEEPLALTPSGLVRGIIKNLTRWPQARVVARVCDLAVRPSRDGRFEVMAPAGVCDVFAQRRDGLFFASSDVITLEIEAGSEHELELWLPDYRQGGVGMGIVEHDEGVLIERVLDGGAAAEAGLQPGDVVLEVDGVPAAALTLEEFVQVTTGEAGTDVELIISRGEGSDREESIYLLDRRVME